MAAEKNSKPATVVTRNNHTMSVTRKSYRIFFLTMTLFGMGIKEPLAQFAKSAYVIRDPRIDMLVEKQIELNKQAFNAKTFVVQGFRIQVVSTNKRDLALDVKTKLLRHFPDQKSYMYYQSPNFKVHFGNFRTYEDANRFKKEMSIIFGEDILVVPSRVEVRGEELEGPKK